MSAVIVSRLASALLLISLVILRPLSVQADEKLDAIILEELEDTIRSKNAGFQKITAQTLLSDEFVGLDEPWKSKRLNEQIPSPFLSAPPDTEISVLYVPGCQGSALDGFGISDGIDLSHWGGTYAEIMLEDSFSKSGYSLDITARKARDLFSRGFGDIDSWPTIKQFNQDLFDMHRDGRANHLFLLYDGDLCGDGGVEIEFDVDNSFREVALIPEFFFRICSRRYGSAWDRSTCHWWLDVEAAHWISGVYVWQARNGDGELVWGRKNVENLAFGRASIP